MILIKKIVSEFWCDVSNQFIHFWTLYKLKSLCCWYNILIFRVQSFWFVDVVYFYTTADVDCQTFHKRYLYKIKLTRWCVICNERYEKILLSPRITLDTITSSTYIIQDIYETLSSFFRLLFCRLGGVILSWHQTLGFRI